MIWYLLNVYVHILSAVLLIGFHLFWVIMVCSMATQKFDASESNRLLRLINQSRWPPPGVPSPYRIPFPGVSWAIFSVLVITGIFMLPFQRFTLPEFLSGKFLLERNGQLFAIKLFLVIILGISQVVLTRRLTSWSIYLNMVVVLLLAVVSVLFVH